ncbi:DivIVA domain-containing protein [Kitasatospora sp. NBC_01287]|uniref:DivIVA domain-containing protein n=1 Tax=Kitasatospora sp. NBC_01287 TaxID=2903573 RepID=UPI0022564A32|nr:DivIVA domain-containing protein [Kitasatospora sp. NBC_01287]MCX4744093.1 DivIVA domain-containing protein [Kitasatospora sp. NBC_01287]
MAEFRGFDLVRRGYDRAAVDAFLTALAPGAAPADVPAFPIVRRGYAPEQVDARIAELLAAHRT